MSYQDQQELGDTLALVNMARTAMGFDPLSELPNARVGDPGACLFYRGLADCGAKNVGGSSVEFSSDRQASLVASLWGVRPSGNSVPLPSQFRKVISDFDANRLSHYNV